MEEAKRKSSIFSYRQHGKQNQQIQCPRSLPEGITNCITSPPVLSQSVMSTDIGPKAAPIHSSINIPKQSRQPLLPNFNLIVHNNSQQQPISLLDKLHRKIMIFETVILQKLILLVFRVFEEEEHISAESRSVNKLTATDTVSNLLRSESEYGPHDKKEYSLLRSDSSNDSNYEKEEKNISVYFTSSSSVHHSVCATMSSLSNPSNMYIDYPTNSVQLYDEPKSMSREFGITVIYPNKGYVHPHPDSPLLIEWYHLQPAARVSL